MRSFRRETLARSFGKPFGIRSFQTAAVRLSAKERITLRYVARITLVFKGYQLRALLPRTPLYRVVASTLPSPAKPPCLGHPSPVGQSAYAAAVTEEQRWRGESPADTG